MAKKSKPEKNQEVAVKSSKSEASVPAERGIEDLFEDFLNRRWPKRAEWPGMRWPKLEFPSTKSLEAKIPSMDVVDRETEVLVRAELPGIDKADIDVSVSGNSVTIQGSTRKETESDEEQYHHREIVSSYVSRTLPLPCEVDGDSAEAKLNNGVLEVTIPKVEKARRKRIEIQS